jgi:hypothetical protein
MSSTLEDWFQRTFGAPFPFPIDEPLVQTAGSTHWATHPQLSPEALVIPTFPDAPPCYTVVGHWGHGIGSQAFYFVRREEHHRCFLRVGFGGAYDPAERGGDIVAALTTYRDLLKARSLVASEIVYSIGTGHAALELEGGDSLSFDTWSATAGPGARAPRVDEFMRYVVRRITG